MNFDTDSIVYHVKMNGIEACGFVKYGSGEFYSDEFGFATSSPCQSGTVRQLGEWMESMEKQGYKFLSAEDLIESL